MTPRIRWRPILTLALVWWLVVTGPGCVDRAKSLLWPPRCNPLLTTTCE